MDSNKGATSSTIRPTSSVLTNSAPEHSPYNAQAAAHNPLELFQWLVGIHTPPCLKHSFDSKVQGDNIDLYQRSEDQNAEAGLHLCCIASNVHPVQARGVITSVSINAQRTKNVGLGSHIF